MSFIDRSTVYEKKDLTRVHTHYGKMAAVVKGDLGQRACREEDPGSLERMVTESKKILIETFDKHFCTGRYTLEYHLLDYTVEILRRAGKLSVLHSCSYKHFNVQFKQAYERTSQKRLTGMIETVNMMGRSYERALYYAKKEDDG